MSHKRLDCGHSNTREQTFIGPATTALGATMCDNCAHEKCKADLTAAYMAAQPFAAYVSSDGAQLTTFTGESLGVVTRRRVIRKYAWSTLYLMEVVDHVGRKWRGRGQGEGMFVSLRKVG